MRGLADRHFRKSVTLLRSTLGNFIVKHSDFSLQFRNIEVTNFPENS